MINLTNCPICDKKLVTVPIRYNSYAVSNVCPNDESEFRIDNYGDGDYRNYLSFLLKDVRIRYTQSKVWLLYNNSDRSIDIGPELSYIESFITSKQLDKLYDKIKNIINFV